MLNTSAHHELEHDYKRRHYSVITLSTIFQSLRLTYVIPVIFKKRPMGHIGHLRNGLNSKSCH